MKRRLWIALGGLLLIVVLGCGLVLFAENRAMADYLAARAEAKAMGLITAPPRAIPDERNAYFAYRRIMLGDPPPRAVTIGTTPKDRQAAALWTFRTDKALREAGRYRDFDLPTHSASSNGNPPAADCAILVHSLADAALHWASVGESQKCMNALTRAKEITQHVARLQRPIARSLPNAMMNWMAVGGMSALWHFKDDVHVIAEFQRFFDEPFEFTPMSGCISGYEIDSLSEHRIYFGDKNADMVARIRLFRIQAATAGLRNSIRVAKDLESAGNDLAKQTQIFDAADKRREIPGPVGLITRHTSPLFRPLADDAYVFACYQRLSQTTCRLMAIRQKTGHFPKDLADIGEASTDPTDGKPFHYTSTGTGFHLERRPLRGAVVTMHGFSVDCDGKSLKLE